MSKSRLTITLSESTLRKIDVLIDKKNIRNRSHAIESLIEKSLQPRITTAVILAGGDDPQAENFRPLTMLDGKPLISYTIDHLKKYGVTTIIITTRASNKQLEKLLGDGKKLGTNIVYSYEDAPLGTAGALLHANHHRPLTEAFYVVAGDVLTTINLDDMAEFHTHHHGLATMAVKPRVTKESYDNVFLQGHTVVDFQKSTPDQSVSIVNAGLYLFEPEILTYISPLRPSMLEQDVFPKLTSSHKLLAFPFQGIWFDITSDTNYEAALEHLTSPADQ